LRWLTKNWKRPDIKTTNRTRWQRFLWTLRFEIRMAYRNHLACPKCHNIGTYKPRDEPKRYLCKWCGYYQDIARTGWARPCNKKKVWMLKPLKPAKTPMERCGRVDPWLG
jgi:hypothetical protein